MLGLHSPEKPPPHSHHSLSAPSLCRDVNLRWGGEMDRGREEGRGGEGVEWGGGGKGKGKGRDRLKPACLRIYHSVPEEVFVRHRSLRAQKTRWPGALSKKPLTRIIGDPGFHEARLPTAAASHSSSCAPGVKLHTFPKRSLLSKLQISLLPGEGEAGLQNATSLPQVAFSTTVLCPAANFHLGWVYFNFFLLLLLLRGDKAF